MNFLLSFQRFASQYLFALLVVFAPSVNASQIVFDWSPAGSGASGTSGSYGNEDRSFNFQYWGELITFTTDTKIDGMDIYTNASAPYGRVGDPVKIRIWSNPNGDGNLQLTSSLLATISSTVSLVDTDGAVGTGTGGRRLHADFPEFTLVGGQLYLIGMAGDNVDLGQDTLVDVPGGDKNMTRFYDADTTVGQRNGIGDMAFRLWGTESSNVPEPDSLALCALALCLFWAVRRQRVS